MGTIYAYYTCTATIVDEHDVVEELHGWVDERDIYTLFERREDVSPVLCESTDNEDLPFLISDALGEFDSAGNLDLWENAGSGTLYATQADEPFEDEWSYSYAIHFTHKYRNWDGELVEEHWDAVEYMRGCQQCADCDQWVQSETVDPVCFVCGAEYETPDGDAVFLVLDTARHLGTYPNQGELEWAWDQDCRDADEGVDPDQLSLV